MKPEILLALKQRAQSLQPGVVWSDGGQVCMAVHKPLKSLEAMARKFEPDWNLVRWETDPATDINYLILEETHG